MISDYSYQIEQKKFDHLFKKLQPCEGWSDASLTAWSVISSDSLAAAERDSHDICRAWMNSHVRKWGKECNAESTKLNLKDDAGVTLPAILPSKTPLKEFAEASFRTKSEEFDPTAPLQDNLDPGTHLLMAVFGVLIYEINQCASSMSDSNVSACYHQIQVCASYAKVKDDFSSVLNGLPTKLIEKNAEAAKKAILEGKSSKEDYESISAAIFSMDGIEKLLAQVVKIVTLAKTNPAGNSNASALLWTAFGEFDWLKLKQGTFFK